MSLHLWTIDKGGNLATLGEFPDRGRETMKVYSRSGAVAGIFTTGEGVLLSTVDNPSARQLDALKRFAHAVLGGAHVPPPALPPPAPAPSARPQPAPARRSFSRPRSAPPSAPPAPLASTIPAPPEVCPSPTLPPPAPEALFDGPPEIAQDLRTADVSPPVLYAIPGRRVDELDALRARVAELEALFGEARAHADAAASRAEFLTLRLAAAETATDAAMLALARETARADGLAADLARRGNSPRVVEVIQRTAPRHARLAPAPEHPIRALEEHLRRRSER